MSTTVNYPAKINNYSVSISNKETRIRLYELEDNNEENAIGDIHFSGNQDSSQSAKAFINRGGFINGSYPLSLLPSILTLLNQETALFFNEDGSFTNYN